MSGNVYASWEGGSQTATIDKKSTQEVEVFYDGEDDINTASSEISTWLAAYVPDLYAAGGVLWLQRFGPVKRIAPGLFKAIATYGDPEGSGSGGRGGQNNPTSLGEFKIEWDISSATIKQTFSKAGKFAKYVDPDYADPNPHGAIGIKISKDGKKSVEGVDRRYAGLKFSVFFRVPIARVRGINGGLWLRTLRAKAFHRNDAPWLGFNEHELLFIGASGSQAVFGDPEIKFEFETDVVEVITGLGNIPAITKAPHDYLDVVHDTEADDVNKVMVAKPIAAYVHNFYDLTSFRSLFGFG